VQLLLLLKFVSTWQPSALIGTHVVALSFKKVVDPWFEPTFLLL